MCNKKLKKVGRAKRFTVGMRDGENSYEVILRFPQRVTLGVCITQLGLVLERVGSDEPTRLILQRSIDDLTRQDAAQALLGINDPEPDDFDRNYARVEGHGFDGGVSLGASVTG